MLILLLQCTQLDILLAHNIFSNVHVAKNRSISLWRVVSILIFMHLNSYHSTTCNLLLLKIRNKCSVFLYVWKVALLSSACILKALLLFHMFLQNASISVCEKKLPNNPAASQTQEEKALLTSTWKNLVLLLINVKPLNRCHLVWIKCVLGFNLWIR